VRQVPRVKLSEGGLAEMTVVLRKRLDPPEPGRPVPDFSVRTVDGRTLSLDALRGQTILLHFWAPDFGFGGAASLKAVHERFAQDRSFAMIGLCTNDDTEQAAKLIKSNGLSWPQAVLRDGNLDPIVTDYRAYEPNIAFLIGPDGKLIAKVVAGPALENAVAVALGRK
jgi:peroxiredoxin